MDTQIMPKEKQFLQQVEINGVKFEVDMREAKRIDTFKIGDPVKVLKKEYGDNWKQHCGVIVDFTEFVKRPTITIAYLEENYNETKVQFIYINSDTTNDTIEIAPCNEFEMEISKPDVLAKMEKEITGLQDKIREIEFKKAMFIKYFNKYFKEVVTDKQITDNNTA